MRLDEGRESVSGTGPANSPGGSVLRSEGVLDVAYYLGGRFMDRLDLACCAVYLYDRARENLVSAAVLGDDPGYREVVSLAGDANPDDLAGAPGQVRAFICLPLWDSRRLLGVIHGCAREGRVLASREIQLGRGICQGGAVALALALREGRSTDACREDGPIGYGFNPFLAGYLEQSIRRVTGAPWFGRDLRRGCVSMAFIRLVGPGSIGRLPMGGRTIPGLEDGPCGRGFALGPESTGLALVWPETDRRKAREALVGVVGNTSELGQVLGLPPARLRAMALVVFPDDSLSPVALLASAGDFLDVSTYLSCSTHFLEGRVSQTGMTGEPAAALMDSRILSAEIDRLRQALVESISNGQAFSGDQLADLNQRLQDPRTREISERLDRLIIVMQRFMSHRGAVT